MSFQPFPLWSTQALPTSQCRGQRSCSDPHSRPATAVRMTALFLWEVWLDGGHNGSPARSHRRRVLSARSHRLLRNLTLREPPEIHCLFLLARCPTATNQEEEDPRVEIHTAGAWTFLRQRRGRDSRSWKWEIGRFQGADWARRFADEQNQTNEINHQPKQTIFLILL